MTNPRSEQNLLAEIDYINFKLKDNRSAVNKLRMDLLDAETILIGNKLIKEKLVEELRRLRMNRQDE